MNIGKKVALPKALVLVLVWVTVTVLMSMVGPTPAAAQSEGKQLLDELIAKAQKEGALNANGMSAMGPVVSKVVNAFKKRFNLNIDVIIDVTGAETAEWRQMAAMIGAGAGPPYDVYIGNGPKVTRGRKLNFLLSINNWEKLLAEINPLVKSGKVKPEQISWGEIFGGHSFIFMHRINSMMYNTKLIAKNELPPRLIDIQDPKYKGRYVVAPFPTMWQLATLVYPRDKLLKAVDQIGKNAGAVLTYNSGSVRVNLGEFAFMPLALQNLSQILAKDSKAPVAAHYFSDVVSVSHVSHSIPRGTPHPAAASLFTLWMTTPEAEAIWQPILGNPNLKYGVSKLDQETRAAIKSAGSRLVSWFDDEKTLATLRYYGTKKGASFRGKLSRALTQRR